METVQAARLICPPLPGHPSLYWFASIDGELWIEVTDDPRLVDVDTIRRLMGPRQTERGGFVPMKIARRFLRQQGAVFLTGERHE